MNSEDKFSAASREEALSALFAQLVMQQTNMALMLLGRMANPTTGETMHDPQAAGFFIDQLQMLEAKTRGNLNKEEERLLKQSLMSLRMAFVEVVNEPKSNAPVAEKSASSPASEPAATPSVTAQDESDSAKRFSKKY